MSDARILICYDGSPDSRAAVELAAKVFAEARGTVLTVWEPFVEVVERTWFGTGFTPSIPDPDEVDDASVKAARSAAEEGAALASKLGMSAEATTAMRATTTGRTILAEAKAIEATLIVMGSRGLTGLKSLLLGSVSHEVIQHADRAVVVVPSAEVADSRGQSVHGERD